jgi:uncharacterized protein (AIM24 family)
MKSAIANYPGSYLTIEMDQGEQLITEKGSLIYCEGEYDFQSKFEFNNYKNWVAKILGGKSLSYNVYTARESVRMVFSVSDSAEIFCLDITADNPILIEPDLHFARSTGIQLLLEKRDWKSALNDGIKLKTQGSGKLFLKGYGKIIHQVIDTTKPVYVDESALIAFEESLQVQTISKGLKEFITGGEGFMFAIRGKGNIWLQSRRKGEQTSSGGLIEGIFNGLS